MPGTLQGSQGRPSPAGVAAGQADTHLHPNQGGSGVNLDPMTVAEIWRANNPGSSKALEVTMVAIAGAESSYRVDADNGIAAGLWQINYHAHPQWTAQELYDPNTNAQAAMSVYRSQGLTAWTTYTNGAYRQFLGTARKAVDGASRDIGGGPIGAGVSAIGTAAGAAWSAATAVPRFLSDLGSLLFTQAGWMRLLKLFAGIALGIIALHSLFKDTSAGQAVSGKAKDAALAVAA